MDILLDGATTVFGVLFTLAVYVWIVIPAICQVAEWWRRWRGADY